MAKFEGVKRIIKEDFESKDHPLVERLAQPINNALEFIARAMNKGITFSENINCQEKDIEIIVDSSGIPKQDTKYSTTIKGPTRGVIVTRVQNLTNSSSYPTGAPFITFQENNGQIIINHVTGLIANQKYRIRILATG